MKIAVCLNDYGIGVTLHKLYGKDCMLWNPNSKPIYDLLDEYKPDYIFINLESITDLFIRAVSEYNTNIVIYGSGVPEGIEPTLVCAKASTSSLIRRHIEGSAKNIVYQKDCANIPFDVNKDLFSRRNVGHINTTSNPELIKKKIAALSGLSLKKGIVGERMAVEYYLGLIKLDEMHSYIYSNDIYIDFDNTFLLDAAALGKYVISSQQNALFSLFSVDNLEEKCNNIITESKYVHEAKEAQLKIWESDTCFHRVAEVLEAIGAPKAKAARNLIKEKRECVLAY